MIVASIDLGSRIGWSLGPIEAVRPAFGSHQLPATGDDIGLLGYRFRDWLRELIGRLGIDGKIVYEAPVLVPGNAMVTLRKLYGLGMVLEMTCRDMSVDCCEIHLMTMKKYWAGKGNATKQDMMGAALAYGFEVQGHDEADALAARFTMIHAEYPHIAARFPWAMGPLAIASCR